MWATKICLHKNSARISQRVAAGVIFSSQVERGTRPGQRIAAASLSESRLLAAPVLCE